MGAGRTFWLLPLAVFTQHSSVCTLLPSLSRRTAACLLNLWCQVYSSHVLAALRMYWSAPAQLVYPFSYCHCMHIDSFRFKVISSWSRFNDRKMTLHQGHCTRWIKGGYFAFFRELDTREQLLCRSKIHIINVDRAQPANLSMWFFPSLHDAEKQNKKLIENNYLFSFMQTTAQMSGVVYFN